MALRLDFKDLLLNPSRFLLLEAIRRRPGLCFSDGLNLLRAQPGLAASVGGGMLAHHLHCLERGGLVVSRKVGRRRHYYPREAARSFLLDHVALLENPLTRAMAAALLESPGAHQADLARRAALRIPLTSRTARVCLRRLESLRLVQRTGRGRGVLYHPTTALQTAQRWFDDAIPALLDRLARSPEGNFAEAAPSGTS